VSDTKPTLPNPFGSPPKRSSCPANANGYGPHETNADPGHSLIFISDPQRPSLKVFPCKHCAALYAVLDP
jgi:hypothetical protein